MEDQHGICSLSLPGDPESTGVEAVGRAVGASVDADPVVVGGMVGERTALDAVDGRGQQSSERGEDVVVDVVAQVPFRGGDVAEEGVCGVAGGSVVLGNG